jgi:small subunit ribosomal protein S17
MAEEEKQEQEETAADAEAPAEEPAAAEAEVPAEEEAPADEPAGEKAEGGEAGASDEVAADSEVPAATPEPEPAGDGAEGEASGGDVLSPKQLRKRERSRASEARPPRAPEERAAERAERRRAAAERRRRYRAGSRRKRGEPGAGTPAAAREPGPRKVRQGTVVSAGGDKTITVQIAVSRRHATYEKVVRRTSKLRAHDEGNQARKGDIVRVVESRPLSRTKRWRLAEVLERAPQ